MHLNEEELQRLLHGELGSDSAKLVRDHIGECDACNARMVHGQMEEDEINTLLESLDHQLPSIAASTLIAEAKSRAFRPLRWAAGIILFTGFTSGVYAAVAFPDSPLGKVGEPFRRFFERSEVQVIESSVPAEPAGAGIAVLPGNFLSIEFRAGAANSEANVLLTDSSFVTIRTLAGTASFTSNAGRLEIETTGETVVEIQIPRSAPNIDVLVGERRIFQKIGARIVTETSADSSLPMRLRLDRTPNQ